MPKKIGTEPARLGSVLEGFSRRRAEKQPDYIAKFYKKLIHTPGEDGESFSDKYIKPEVINAPVAIDEVVSAFKRGEISEELAANIIFSICGSAALKTAAQINSKIETDLTVLDSVNAVALALIGKQDRTINRYKALYGELPPEDSSDTDADDIPPKQAADANPHANDDRQNNATIGGHAYAG